VRSYEETLVLSADLLAFVTPHVFHPLWGAWASDHSAAFTATRSEFTVCVGYTVLLLAGIALMTIRKSSRGAGFWLLTAAGFALLALGPVLKVNGQTALLPEGGEVPLPYALLYQGVPFFRLCRSVSRMSVMVMLGLGVAASFGTLALAGWLARRPGTAKTLAPLVPVAASLLVAFEFLPAPYPTSPPDTPAWYQTLAETPGQEAVLNLPANWERPGYLLYQTVHNKPMATGYVTRDDPQTLIERAPVLSHFRWLGPDIHTQDFDLTRQGLQVLYDLLGVRWVVLDRYKMPGGAEREVTEAYTTAIFDQTGVLPSFQDERITAYQVPPPSSRAPYLILAPGWPARQLTAEGSPYRALPDGMRAGIEVLGPEGMPFTLEIEASAPAGGNIVLLEGDGGPIATWPTLSRRVTMNSHPLGEGLTAGEFGLRYDGPPDSEAIIHAIRVVEAPRP
jgi:hypothetical protein